MSASRGRSRKSFDRFLRLYRYKDLVFRMTNWPVIRQLGGQIIDYRNTNLTYVPIYQEMELPAGTAAPLSVIEHFIREATHHVILHRCPCRSENGCRDFDPYFGCTFLGPAARDVDPEVGRHVSAEEALEHLYRATEMGLVSCLGKFRGDAIMLGVRDHHRLMTICHCCPCCCISTAIPLASRRARDLLVRMEGLVVEVDPDRCQGCGKCVEACIFRQVRLVEREPTRDSRAAGGLATSAAQGVVATGGVPLPRPRVHPNGLPGWRSSGRSARAVAAAPWSARRRRCASVSRTPLTSRPACGASPPAWR